MNVLMCRLCGINIAGDDSTYIFDETTNLAQKIVDTLPVRLTEELLPSEDSLIGARLSYAKTPRGGIMPLMVSQNDDCSKHICSYCHEKVIRHYDFIQSVLEYSNINNGYVQQQGTTTRGNFEANEKIEIDKIETTATISKSLYRDMIYACPNCNIDLMILIRNNKDLDDHNYAFQISLVIVDEMARSITERNIKVQSEKAEETENGIQEKYKRNLEKFCAKRSCMDRKSHVSSGDMSNNDEQRNIEMRETSLQLRENSDFNADIKFQKDRSEEFHLLGARSRKKLFQESAPHETAVPNKLAKLNVLDVSSNDYNCIDNLIKLKSIKQDVEWLNGEMDSKEENSTVYTTETERDRIEEDCARYEDVDVKSCLKIVCDLCGARYLSQFKYEFHMERHKLDKMDRYVCTVCEKEASSENLLWDHYFHTHKSSVRYACAQCGKLFAKKPRLNDHQKRHEHSGVKEVHLEAGTAKTNAKHEQQARRAVAIEIRERVAVNCSLCGKLITDLDPGAINDLVTCATCEDSTLSLMVDGNEAKVISPRQYHCSKCPKHFVRKERLEFHEMRHNENMNEFVCSTCGKEFSAENSLYEHYLFVHKGARPHICELCGKSFQLKSRLKEHHRTHTGEKPYQCDVCGLRCMTTNALKLHRKTHFSHNRYNCKICDKSFSKKQNMNEHLEKHWKNDKNVSLPQLFTCPVCTEDLPTYRMLKYHMTETHQIDRQDPLITKQKPWHECSDCHEKFKHQMSLKAHKEKVHEGKVNPIFRCDACNATYRIKQLLINHIKSKHSGEKRYKCAQCGKGFNDTKSLYNHILLHTGRKPFVCEYCNMSFRRKDSRDHHRRKHTGEQPYQCPDCEQSFSTYNNRSKHRRREHGDGGDTECPECGERCNNQQEIRVHLNKHLGEKLNELESV